MKPLSLTAVLREHGLRHRKAPGLAGQLGRREIVDAKGQILFVGSAQEAWAWIPKKGVLCAPPVAATATPSAAGRSRTGKEEAMKVWECWPEGNERGDYEAVTAMDADDAAVEFAETYDRESGEGYADERIIFVAHVKSATVERFRVCASVSVDYSADLLGPDES